MSWGALGVSAYADMMGIYCEHIQGWLDQAKADLTERELLDQFYHILGIGDFFTGSNSLFGESISYPVDDMDKQLEVLTLANNTGTRFEFSDGKSANGWIGALVRGCDDNNL